MFCRIGADGLFHPTALGGAVVECGLCLARWGFGGIGGAIGEGRRGHGSKVDAWSLGAARYRDRRAFGATLPGVSRLLMRSTIVRLIGRLVPADFARNALKLVSGTTISQLIPIAVAPILTRVYSPAEFGVFGVFMALSTVIGTIATARYELAVMLPSEDDDAAQIVALALLISVGVSAFTLGAIVVFGGPIASFLGAQDARNSLYAVPLMVFLLGAYQTLNNLASRRRSYGALAMSRVYKTASGSLTQVGLGFMAAGPVGLISGSLLGQGISDLALLLHLRRNGEKRVAWPELAGMRRQARRFQSFPKSNSLHALADVLRSNGAVVIVGHLLSAAAVGQYQLMLRVVGLPSSVLGNAVSQVFYQEATSRYQQGRDLRPALRKMLLALAAVMLLPATILVVFGTEIFSFVFGPDWRVAGQLTAAIAPYMVFHFAVAPISFVPMIMDRQGTALRFSLFGNFAFLAFVAYGGASGDLVGGLRLASLLLPVYFIIYIAWVFRISRRGS